MSETIRFPGSLPDYLAHVDRTNPRVGQHGVRLVHHTLLSSAASECAIKRTQSTDPSERAILLTRETLFDELARMIQPWLPPFDEELAALRAATTEGGTR